LGARRPPRPDNFPAMTVYRQIYQRLRTSIEEGKLRAGDRLP
jgi:DNA-binding GntR family transcriptional regulator